MILAKIAMVPSFINYCKLSTNLLVISLFYIDLIIILFLYVSRFWLVVVAKAISPITPRVVFNFYSVLVMKLKKKKNNTIVLSFDDFFTILQLFFQTRSRQLQKAWLVIIWSPNKLVLREEFAIQLWSPNENIPARNIIWLSWTTENLT